ncbi:GDSL esterase/lipase 7-like [Dioscorea cayenensis subsp. rotundata]|uniref:GDSL esterase/lipase 7-like n=1 Tax=Dioscorea cayennensis subsp. rotundata TaxID=55577 RepID=A0AB40B050_DIOCR|nr:GDSL esterase/lipase 7-like [Dioscorea cayenensis subsp. rotundata]
MDLINKKKKKNYNLDMRVCFPFSTNLSILLVIMISFFIPISECAKAPAIFIFGDSLIDNGNNNHLPSIAKANYFPYGIDYGMPTGRFSNGLTVMDYAAKWLGFPFPPPYLSLQSKTMKILKGVNYASAAAGILDETGRHYGGRVAFNGQIKLFEKTVKLELPMLISDNEVLSKYLANSIFLINIGSNDYINNYLLPNMYTSSKIYSPKVFARLLINTFTDQLTRLYRVGARKMVLVGIGPLGCIPSQLSMNNSTTGLCIQRVNDIVSAFNQLLLPLSTSLNSTLPGSFFVYHNTYDTFFDMVNNPSNYGFTVTNEACCGSGKYGGTMSCLPYQQPCNARDKFIFWDSFHPTQAVNAIIAQRCYTPSATQCYPISAYQLSLL